MHIIKEKTRLMPTDLIYYQACKQGYFHKGNVPSALISGYILFETQLFSKPSFCVSIKKTEILQL